LRVLVTGGAGFIGSHVADEMIRAGHSVAVVDDLSTGRLENVHASVRFYQCDVRDDLALSQVFDEELPDVVSHHAGQVDLRRSMLEPVLDGSLNILGSVNVFEQCRKHRVKKIIYASSGGAIYGEPVYLPCDEYHPVAPTSFYGVSKYTVEQYLRVYYAQYGVEYTVLRYANVYGSRQVASGECGVVATFATRMLADEKVTIFGTGEQRRDFVHVSDVARANVATLAKGNRQSYNIGTGVSVSINILFEHMSRLAAYSMMPAHRAARLGETYAIYLNVSKAALELGWAPEIGLDEGLVLSLQSYGQ
jgi:UDP-glucose 4-epimerase